MPEATLLELVARQADDEARRIAESAAAGVDAIRAEAASREAAEIRARVAARARELDARNTRAIVDARRAARLALLTARDDVVARVMAAARDQLGAVDLPENVLARLVDAGRPYLPSGAIVVRCPTRQLAAMRALTAEQVVVDESIRAGVRLESADGRIVVDNTLEGRLECLRRTLAIALTAHVPRP